MNIFRFRFLSGRRTYFGTKVGGRPREKKVQNVVMVGDLLLDRNGLFINAPYKFDLCI